MSRAEKIVKKWRKSKNSKQPIELTEVETVLYGIFGDYLIDDVTTGSHLYHIKHPEFIRIKGSTKDGIITIVSHKKKVKRVYIDNILKAINIIEDTGK